MTSGVSATPDPIERYDYDQQTELEPLLHRPIAIQRLLASPLGAVLAPLIVREPTFAASMARVISVHECFDAHEHWRAVSARGAHRRAHDLLHYMPVRRLRRERWERWVTSFSSRERPIALARGTRDPSPGSMC